MSRSRAGAVVTPEAFRVAPGLLGLPLASPWQRLAAAALDGLLIAALSQSRGVLLGLALAALVWSGAGAWIGRNGQALRRRTLQLGWALLAFLLAVAVLDPLLRWAFEDPPEAAATAAPDALSGLDTAQRLTVGVAVAQLMACETADCRRERLEAVLAPLVEAGPATAEQRQMLEELVSDAASDPAERAALSARVLAARPLSDSARPATTARPAATASTPADPAAPDEAPGLIDDQGRFSLLATLRLLADEIGLSLGWAALYFTCFTVWWRGQTPGKRLLGLRVVHLGGERLGYWRAFERYGGYAAGFATGLLGFLQAFRDHNRQAIQDKLAFTAVIREPRPAEPAPVPAAASGEPS
ncbi:MAG TPA: RDD family protein [Nevskiaceae bacterium]|nr:RDD family protein [Nevskiaceae bacterium]